MKILVIGSGGREHALAWKLRNDSAKPAIYCAPGNAGTASVATNVPVQSEDIDGLLKWANANRPDLTVVGPEAPLCLGVVDRFAAAGFRIFGPSAAAAQMEGSKAFSKDVMAAGGVPTARSAVFTNAADAVKYAASFGGRIVVKADGLAAGKGVTVCSSLDEAKAAINAALVDRVFGAAGGKVVLEEVLEGEEASILALVDGEHVVMLASAQDHKRIFDDDRGPNTGGMGAYSPAPVVSDDLWPAIRTEVFGRTLAELKKRGITYKGVLYAGLMIKDGKLGVLEFNCRFGDPETQAVLARLKSDLVPALEACIDGNLSEKHVEWRNESSVCIVMAAGGYPGSYEKGKPIAGLAEAGRDRDVVVFHAGTTDAGGKVVTAGGRVLGVTAVGPTMRDAIAKGYKAAAAIRFDGVQYRKDIGAKALTRGLPSTQLP